MERQKQKALKGKTWYTDKEMTEEDNDNRNKVGDGKMKKPSQKAGNKV